MTRLVGAELSACGVLSKNYVQGSREEAQSLPPPKLLCSSGHFVFLQMHTPSVCQPLVAQMFTGWLLVFFFNARDEAQSFVRVRQVRCQAQVPSNQGSFQLLQSTLALAGVTGKHNQGQCFCLFLSLFFEIGSYVTQLGLELPM